MTYKSFFFFYGSRSVYGSTNPYTHVVSMLSNTNATLNSKKLEVIKIPINLTLNEVSYAILRRLHFTGRFLVESFFTNTRNLIQGI